ncbi:copper resistance CopC family protein [Corynebacterium pilosum]|uniref:Copper resistance protein CopC n=1 Tax=Corynebacterium pilosum TaxID=35756 RepID=A0A376CSI1_9CORY|nr:copper resistance protein CopC [Corynebacterium pilosum]STC70588.1 Copper resistance protein CopC [Corynebacterium pilosum]
MLRSTRRALAATSTGMLLAASALCGPVAVAHDSVIGGSPHNEEVVDTFPDTITLEFSGYVKDDFNTFAISDADTQEVLFSGEPTVEGRDVSLEVPEDIDPGPGNYRIGFQITSSDGHATRGMTTFTVAGEPQNDAAQESSPEADETQESSSTPCGWIIGGGLVAIVIIGALIAVAGKRS